jgi:hypothetical protein
MSTSAPSRASPASMQRSNTTSTRIALFWPLSVETEPGSMASGREAVQGLLWERGIDSILILVCLCYLIKVTGLKYKSPLVYSTLCYPLLRLRKKAHLRAPNPLPTGCARHLSTSPQYRQPRPWRLIALPPTNQANFPRHRLL